MSANDSNKQILVLKHPLLFTYDLALYLKTTPSNVDTLLLYFSQDVSELKFNANDKVPPHVNKKKRYFIPFSMQIEFKEDIEHNGQKHSKLILPTTVVFNELPYYFAFDITPIPTCQVFSLSLNNIVKDVKGNLPAMNVHKGLLEKFVNNIYNSELKLASYSEVSSINDNGTEVYNKSTLFKLTRGTKTVTEVKTVEKKLSVSGTTMYDETTESYKTIDNIKYNNVVSYDEKNNVPDYFLSDIVENDGWEAKNISLDSEVNSIFLRRLALSSNYIQSMKGTRKGIEAILGMFGYYPYDGKKGEYIITEYIAKTEKNMKSSLHMRI
jgi:hypothetical protein